MIYVFYILLFFLKTPCSQNWRFVAFSANISTEADLYASAILKVDQINNVTTDKYDRGGVGGFVRISIYPFY